MNGENQTVLCDIARCAFDVINQLLSRDQLLADSLRSTATGSRQIYREECITVEIAATLRERFRDQVTIILFTPPEEKRTGADWYWRFERGGRAIHARVQAKRVQRTDFGAEDASGHVDLDIPQLQNLVEQARSENSGLAGLQAWLATYGRRERATPPCGSEDLSQCILHGHTRQCAAPNRPSLWIANAEEFAGASPRISLDGIVKKSVRLDCLLPCIGRSESQGPKAKGFALQSDLPTFDECVATIEGTALRQVFEGALVIRE